MSIQRDKLERSLGGIENMKKIPDMIFVIDTNVESLAVKEAQKLNIPIVAVVDTNSNPMGINFPIPGNDDARRAINLYCELIKQTVKDAQKNMVTADPSDSQLEVSKKDSAKAKISKTDVVANEEINKKLKKDIIKKKSTSIFSKIKKFTVKKSK